MDSSGIRSNLLEWFCPGNGSKVASVSKVFFAVPGQMRFPHLTHLGLRVQKIGNQEEPLTAEALCRAIPGLERLDNNLHITNLRDVIYVTVGLVSRQGEGGRVAWASPSSDSS
ncbi:hypothetical protein TNCV_1046091 [Trichonephila clavipes]|nr:hypothetical protein TNCV_1046091 [Trichonephila clavipes]